LLVIVNNFATVTLSEVPYLLIINVWLALLHVRLLPGM